MKSPRATSRGLCIPGATTPGLFLALLTSRLTGSIFVNIDNQRLEAAYQTALQALLTERHADGYWVGELSTSALSTATAVMALSLVQKHAPTAGSFEELIHGGLQWLVDHQNDDGGWGDTVVSISNISTTMLCRSALYITGTTKTFADTLQKAETWLHERYGQTPQELAEAVRKRYGKDRTFAVPILTTCALAGLVDWKEVPPLPFELACFPQSWFRLLRLHVVSYALPALIAIGQCIHHHRPGWNPLTRLTRWLSKSSSLRVLETIQPSNGGFLEATPLTSFVTLSLAGIGLGEHPVAKKGVAFIIDSVRPDGSWPIDTNLSTWVTTLSINALEAAGELESLDKKAEVRDWLLRQQYREKHPYTGADPGAWAWTPLPGGVPDADDTPGALLALQHIDRISMESERLVPSPLVGEGQGGGYGLPITPTLTLPHQGGGDQRNVASRTEHGLNCDTQDRIARGLKWLDDLQNSDGGWPTFCRGWGALPFDRSGSDLTAHVLRAIRPHEKDRTATVERGFRYLAKQQHPDGSWLPLWFGNQHAADDINPTYGTAKVLAAYRDYDKWNDPAAQRGLRWLLENQNDDGGWGGCKGTPSGIEETALAVEILVDAGSEAAEAVNKGTAWLVDQVEAGQLFRPTPIGFYFAKLWYFERLYPIIFTVAALGRVRRNRISSE